MASIGTSYGAYHLFGWETVAYGTQALSINKVLGDGCNLSLSENNNLEVINALGSRNATSIVAKQYDGKLTSTFICGNFWWLRGVLGAAPTKAGVGPYTYTWTAANGGISDSIQSFTMDIYQNLDTDKMSELLGCRINSATITCAKNEIVKANIDVIYKNLAESSPAFSTASFDAEEPFVFYQGSFQAPNGTTHADMQSMEITIENNLEGVNSLGSRFISDLVPKQRGIKGKISLMFEDYSKIWQLFHGNSAGPQATSGPSATATCTITLTNGGASTALRSLVIILANLQFDSHDINFAPGELLVEDVPFTAESITSVVWTNNSSSEA
jgi:hypothetical protein